MADPGQGLCLANLDGVANQGRTGLRDVCETQYSRHQNDSEPRGTNLLDTGSHFYDVYECSDGEYISIGSIEPQFYAELLRLSGLDLPNANTLIVHRADMFGLAQLYQLRGRVGRSKTRAYAYFTIPVGNPAPIIQTITPNSGPPVFVAVS